MTNREWLNSLSDEDFAKWCCNDELILISMPWKFDKPLQRLKTLKILERGCRNGAIGLAKWLKEKRDDKSQIIDSCD